MSKDLSFAEILKITRNLSDAVLNIKLKVKKNKVNLVREFLLNMQEYKSVNNTTFKEYYGLFSRTFIVGCPLSSIKELIDFVLDNEIQFVTFRLDNNRNSSLLIPEVELPNVIKLEIDNYKIKVTPISGKTGTVVRSIWLDLNTIDNSKYQESLDQLGLKLVKMLASFDERFENPTEPTINVPNCVSDYSIEQGAENPQELIDMAAKIASEVK